MGFCCSSNNANTNDTNLSRKDNDITAESIDPKILPTLIKAQARMRGLLARKRVMKQYGFQMSAGLFNRRNNLVEMDPVKLEEQRQKVQEIRKALPSFEYGLEEDEENEQGISKETREMTTLPDNAQYEGEWNTATNERHGRGY